jgi:hypothetical protein
MAAFGGQDSCPNCGARMATDQRYCLNCGHRRGDPRLPFMDAVVFMESMSAPPGAGTPPPPPPSPGGGPSPRMNANAALIAGVATLVLALGVGFLIGRSSHDGSNNAAAEAPIKVIEVGGNGGGGESTGTAATEEPTETAKKSTKSSGGNSSKKKAQKKKPSEVKEGSKEEEELAAEKTAETLHAEGPLAKPTAKVGETCEKGTPGCKGEEFTGEFFGE